jgi:hypothetical protein
MELVMRLLIARIAVVLGAAIIASTSLQASEDSIGPNGINSLGIALDGMGISIGQVEPGRPGKFGFDTAVNCCNDKIVPSGVFVHDLDADEDQAIRSHAMWVAGVMISRQTAVPTPPPVRSPPIGVAQQASLYSAAFLDPDQLPPNLQAAAAVAAQHIATLPNVDIRAINMSFLVPLDPGEMLDGNSTLTQFIDWSSSQHDRLYVVAGSEGGTDNVPTDEFNGLTVAASKKEADGSFRKVAAFNDFNPDDDLDPEPIGPRTATDLIAPGENLDLAGPNGELATGQDRFGTSYAAPHVTGTVALLQQHAESRINASAPGWDADARRHQVMKAILMNSADKIKDTGNGQFLGMERTVIEQVGDDTWLDSDAFSDENIPLDEEMGAGHLNAKRALTQFAPAKLPLGALQINQPMFH